MTVLALVEAALAELATAPTVDDVRAKLDAGLDLSELEALVSLRHCLDTGQTDLIAMAMAEDVQLSGKWHRARGREDVLTLLTERAAARAAELQRRCDAGFAPSRTDDSVHGPVLRTLIHFVDGRFGGFSLSSLDEHNSRTSGSFHVKVANASPAGEGSTLGRIQTIRWHHFENLVSGFAQFGALSCIPNVDLSRNKTIKRQLHNAK